MKRLGMALAAIFLLMSGPANAGLLDIGGLAQLISDKTKESRGGSLFDAQQKVSAAAYLPIWTIHDAAGAQYVHWGMGGAIRQGQGPRPLGIVAVNLPAISARLLDFQWAKDHVSRTAFPPIWLGPYLQPPYLASGPWVIGKMVGGMISIGIGGQP